MLNNKYCKGSKLQSCSGQHQLMAVAQCLHCHDVIVAVSAGRWEHRHYVQTLLRDLLAECFLCQGCLQARNQSRDSTD